MHNTFKIPIKQLNEQEGTITFAISESNLFDKDVPSIRIFEIAKNQTVFILERDSNFNLDFIQSNPNYETKITRINISDFRNASKLFICLTWSEKENALWVGGDGIELRSEKSLQDSNIKFRVGKDGAIYQIGDKEIKVESYRIKIGKEVVLESTAKEIFDFQMKKARILIENCKKGDFLFESTLSQQIIVMLTTAFEVYARTRFIELEREFSAINMDDLYTHFISINRKEQYIKEIKEAANMQEKTELEVFIEKRSINFQNWNSFKDAYNKGYGLKIGEINISNDILVEIQKFINWRHEIIHSNFDQTMINFEEVPSTDPIFTNKDLAERGLNTFQKFIDKIHKSTSKL